jgi:hypothetical protein
MATGRIPDANTAPLTAKGDLYTYSTANARLAVGSNGDTLVADSAASTGLRWQGNYSAGKNKIINGDFGIWQRGTSFSINGNTDTYTADRFYCWHNGSSGTGTNTVSRQAFSIGQTDVPNNPLYFHRWTVTTLGTSQGVIDIRQKIEDVTTFSNQTMTFSFYAKSSSAISSGSLVAYASQLFGTGGSATVDTQITLSSSAVSTSWTRYTGTVAIPSVSGKTSGAGNNLQVFLRLNVTTGTTFDVANWQVEAGSVATAFQTATGTLQGELAACQRYYFRSTPGSTYGSNTLLGYNDSTTVAVGYIVPPVPMRVKPTSIEFANQTVLPLSGSSQAVTAMAISNYAHSQLIELEATVASGLTAGAVTRIRNNNNTAGYIGLSAEL